MYLGDNSRKSSPETLEYGNLNGWFLDEVGKSLKC